MRTIAVRARDGDDEGFVLEGASFELDIWLRGMDAYDLDSRVAAARPSLQSKSLFVFVCMCTCV